MTERTIWVCFDLEFKADYQGLYTWLDKMGAEECGDHLAVIKYKTGGDLLNEIERDVKLHVKLGDKDRFYIVYKDDASGRVLGRFISGGRKRPIWEGYWRGDQSETVDE